MAGIIGSLLGLLLGGGKKRKGAKKSRKLAPKRKRVVRHRRRVGKSVRGKGGRQFMPLLGGSITINRNGTKLNKVKLPSGFVPTV